MSKVVEGARYPLSVRVVMLEAPPEVVAMLAERRRMGLRTVDGKLEITWDGGFATV